MKKIERTAAKIINKVIDIETYGWRQKVKQVQHRRKRPQKEKAN